jgi:hypothetical protein
VAADGVRTAAEAPVVVGVVAAAGGESAGSIALRFFLPQVMSRPSRIRD